VIDSGAHIVNMSYGEPTSRPGFGRFMELLQEAVAERGVIFISRRVRTHADIN
jgi:tripeptidyl-peptidase II